MKRYIIAFTLITGCLAGCAHSNLSKNLVGLWQSTHFDAFGTPGKTATVLIEFKPNRTWISEARTATETNRWHGTYSVSKGVMTLHSSTGQPTEDCDRYTYCNGMLVSIGADKRNVAIKVPGQNNFLDPIAEPARDARGSSEESE